MRQRWTILVVFVLAVAALMPVANASEGDEGTTSGDGTAVEAPDGAPFAFAGGGWHRRISNSLLVPLERVRANSRPRGGSQPILREGSLSPITPTTRSSVSVLTAHTSTRSQHLVAAMARSTVPSE
jgi:hypothetical protein